MSGIMLDRQQFFAAVKAGTGLVCPRNDGWRCAKIAEFLVDQNTLSDEEKNEITKDILKYVDYLDDGIPLPMQPVEFSAFVTAFVISYLVQNPR